MVVEIGWSRCGNRLGFEMPGGCKQAFALQNVGACFFPALADLGSDSQIAEGINLYGR